ncbi:hypothetical protein [Streptosporangium amethystogenes]|uniref:hypothetical protein n=1 Tax=Streptosporangium amethystogenes TaxID=2002 RepID=UPI0014703E4E|nr:hypothetical protein [Streptosporangium amethystogenes]
MASDCGCFVERPPLPMGCAVCGHAPYAHGCPGQAADHEYAQPSGELMAERLDMRRRVGLGQALPTFEPIHEVTAQLAAVVPAPRQAERETPSARTRPPGRTDTRRPAMPGAGRPHRPVEPREDRAARLALARDPLTRRRALITARAPEPSPQSAKHQTRHPHPAEPPAQRAPLPPDINPNPREPATPMVQRTLIALPDRRVTTTVQRRPTMSPDIPGTEERRPAYQEPRPWFAITSGRGRPSSWQEVAA